MDESASAHAARPQRPALPRSAAGLRLDAWRERGADRMDPVRFRFMEALERRAARMPAPPARCWTSAWPLLDAYAADLERDEAAPLATRRGIAADTPIDAPLPADTLASLARALDTGHAVPWRDAHPELPLLDVYRDIWAKVSANRQLRQSEQQVPDNAGPLNSNNLVHRSLALMRQLSPGYLHQFLSYLDALAWMEQFDGAVTAARKPRAAGGRAAGQDGRPPPPSAAGPRRPDAPSDLRTQRPQYDPYTNHIRITYMGIVKISEQMHENLRVASAALSRSINSQAEHWMRIGMLSELYPSCATRTSASC